MDIEQIDGNKWISIVNSEILPSKDAYSKRFYKLGNKYVIHVASGFGNFISPMVDTEDELKAEEAKIDIQFNVAKGGDWTQLKATALNPIPSPF